MEVSKKATRALNEWVDDGYYIYMRPSSTCWHWPDDDPVGTFWSVTVEWRSVTWIHWEAKGDDLDAVLKELAKIIPRRRELDPNFIPADEEGCQFGAMTRNSAAPKLEHGKVYVEVREQPKTERPNPGIREDQKSYDKKQSKKTKKGKKK